VERMMRHSKLEMTGRYTRPRAVDIEAAAAMLPSLKPDVDHDIERAIMTGTDSSPISILDATENASDSARSPGSDACFKREQDRIERVGG
jgi:hypothetical protein